MQNYAPETIVPVGTKVVRTKECKYLKTGKVYTVVNNTSYGIVLEGYKYMEFTPENFAPYEEEKKVSFESIAAKEESIGTKTSEPQIIQDTKALNIINLEDANDLFIKREAEARIQKRSETKSKLLERINFNSN